jgi:hypothetical protein
MPPGSWSLFEEVWVRVYQFDVNAFLRSAQDMHGFELAAFDTLQRSLARDAKPHHGLAYGQETVVSFTPEACLELVIHPNAPGSARRDLFAPNEAIIDVAVER